MEWLTQPYYRDEFEKRSKKYCSFYAYNEVNKRLIRIRLELDRTPINSVADELYPSVFVKDNRFVGFAKDIYQLESCFWEVDKTSGIITYKRDLNCYERLLTIPMEYFYVYDFSITPNSFTEIGDPNSKTIHRGSSVVIEENFPKVITRKHLRNIANYFANKEEGNYIIIQDSNPSEDDFLRALRNL